MKLLRSISDKELVERLRKLIKKEKSATLEILPHLAEVHRPGLYLAKGYGGLYEYCKGELGYTDASAWRRVRAALAIHRCPEALGALERGRVRMCTLGRVYKFITPALLREICDKSQAEVELIAAVYDAKGVSPDRTRPVVVPVAAGRRREKRNDPAGHGGGQTTGLRSEVVPGQVSGSSTNSLRSEVSHEDKKLEFERKWKLEGVVSEEIKRKLDRCKSLLSTKYPNGIDYDKLFDELTEVFLERKDPERRLERRKKRQAVIKHKSKEAKSEKITRSTTSSANPRYIPRSAQDRVWARDGGKCTFVGADGKRCNSSFNLQFDHFPIPFARGGPSTVDNLRLLCARHNKYTAEQVFGKAHMKSFYDRRNTAINTAQRE